MSDVIKDFTGVLLAIVSVAILYVLVAPNNQTGTVAKDVFGGFSQALTAAMGGGAGGG
jgi:PRD1 phage membrane DNA delivery